MEDKEVGSQKYIYVVDVLLTINNVMPLPYHDAKHTSRHTMYTMFVGLP